MKNIVGLALLLLLCTGCTINYVRDSSGVNIDARKDIKVTDTTPERGVGIKTAAPRRPGRLANISARGRWSCPLL